MRLKIFREFQRAAKAEKESLMSFQGLQHVAKAEKDSLPSFQEQWLSERPWCMGTRVGVTRECFGATPHPDPVKPLSSEEEAPPGSDHSGPGWVEMPQGPMCLYSHILNDKGEFSVNSISRGKILEI